MLEFSKNVHINFFVAHTIWNIFCLKRFLIRVTVFKIIVKIQSVQISDGNIKCVTILSQISKQTVHFSKITYKSIFVHQTILNNFHLKNFLIQATVYKEIAKIQIVRTSVVNMQYAVH